MKRSGSLKHPGARVVWDEENLGFWEANKTPRQKIAEPKTPYHPPETEGTIQNPTPAQQAAHADAIRLALSQVASTSEARADEGTSASSSGPGIIPGREMPDFQEPKTMGMDIDEPSNQLKRRKSFEEKRHKHQIEYRKAKSMLSHQPPMVEDDETDYPNQASGSFGSCSTSSQDDQESNISKVLGDIDIQDA